MKLHFKAVERNKKTKPFVNRTKTSFSHRNYVKKEKKKKTHLLDILVLFLRSTNFTQELKNVERGILVQKALIRKGK